jgi:hypothetical protein
MSEQPLATPDFPGLGSVVVNLLLLPRLEQLALLRADQGRRWTAGERIRVEDYLQYLPPAWAEEDGALLDLLFAEMHLREEIGEHPTSEEYAGRFPHLAEKLAQRLAEPPTSHPTTPSASPQTEDGTPATTATVRTPHIPGYEIEAELGHGGMGIVYRARQQSLRRLVALKMILHGEHVGDDARRRFQGEAEAIAALQHPHIVEVHEVGEHNGTAFFSMEFCSGGSLEKQLDGTPWEPRRAASLVETLAGAVQAAHQAGLIHRDLKPGNVLLTADGVPKVTDFGLVKRVDVAGQTQSGAVVGTPSYMAPEQAGGKGREIGPAGTCMHWVRSCTSC